MMRAILLVCLVVACAFASDVIDAKDSDFESIVKSNDFVLMEFYAPWCGHCKKLVPEWEAAATKLKGKAVVAKLDATVETQAAGAFDIKGYPTIKVFRGGNLQGDYEGGRTADAIVSYVLANSGPAVTEVSTAEELTQLKEEFPVVVTIFAKDVTSEMFTAFQAVASAQRASYKFVSVKDESLFDGNDNSVVVYKKFDDKRVAYAGEATEAELASFIVSAGIRSFDEIGPDNYKSYIDRKLPIGWLFVKPSEASAEKSRDAVASIASEFKEKMSLVWIDAEKYGGMAQRLGLSGESFPAFAIDAEGTHFVFPVQGEEISADAIKEFIGNFVDGKLEKTTRSEATPEKATVEGVTTVVGNNFEELISKGDKDVLIEFYAPWCGHCKKLAPIFDELGKKLEKADVLIAKIDATANDYDQKMFKVEGFPTIFFVPKNTHEPINFEGARTLEGMLEFIKEKATAPIDVTEDEL